MWDTKLNWTKVRASLFIHSKAFSIFLALAKLKLYHLCTSPHRTHRETAKVIEWLPYHKAVTSDTSLVDMAQMHIYQTLSYVADC